MPVPRKRARIVEGSCWSCRRRRVLCDLQRPSCSRCADQRCPCDYTKTRLKWVDGVAARGRLAGRSAPVEDASLTSPAGAGPPCSQLPVSIDAAMSEERLLLYFANAFFPRFNLDARRCVDIDLASITRDPVLRQAIVAVANAHYVLLGRTSSSDTLLAKKQARIAALAGLREQISNGRDASPPALFMATVFHCVLDGIIEPGDEGAAMFCHFQGGKAILAQQKCLGELNAVSQGLSAFAISVFGTMDLVYALLSGHDPYFDRDWMLSRAEKDCWWGRLKNGDPFLEVLSILTQLAQLGHHARESQTCAPIGDLLIIQSALEKNSFRTASQLAASESNGASDCEQQRSWAAFCSTYRHTALIYMYRALCNLEVDHQLVQQAAKDGFNAICNEELTGDLTHCLLFPMLVIGAHCLDKEHRSRLRRTLHSTASYLSFGSLQLVDQFLQEVWSSGNMNYNWWDCFEEFANRASVF